MSGEANIAIGMAASSVAALISALGIVTMVYAGARAHRFSAYFSSFAVGVLAITVLFHLLPRAINDFPDAWQWALIGFGVVALARTATVLVFAKRADDVAQTLGYVSILALGFHSFLDGFIYTAAFQPDIVTNEQNIVTGLIAVSGLLLHEYPEGIIAFLLLREAGHSATTSAVGAFVAAGLSTVFGTFVGDRAIDYFTTPPIGALYGAAAGALIFVLLVHLIPHAWRTPKGRGYFAAGIGVIVGTIVLILESIAGPH